MTHPSSADETGWADLDALTVRYAFPADELARQLDAFDGTEPLPDVLRTFVHEHVHFDHAVSTPFGFLLHRLRRIQSYATCDIIRVLRQDLGLRLRLPLLRYVRTLPAEARDAIYGPLQYWYAAERFATEQQGSFQAVEGVLVKDLNTAARDPLVDFRELQAIDCAINGIAPAGASVADVQAVLRAEPADPDNDDVAALQVGLMFTSSLDSALPGVLESAGRAAEHINDGDADIAFLFGDRARRADEAHYEFLTMIIGSRLQRWPTRVRVLSYLAMAELALFGPVLPEHFRIRGGLRWMELSPLLRLVKSGTILADIDPATDADDVERFQDDICAALSWVPPRAIRESTVYRPNSRLFDRFYAEGLALRRRSPGILCEPRNRLARSDIGEFLRSTFTFPIVGYADGQPVVRPGPLEVEHQRETLWHRWMRRLMIAKSPTVEVPWDSDDLDDLAAALRERLSREIGGPAPAPQLVAPST